MASGAGKVAYFACGPLTGAILYVKSALDSTATAQFPAPTLQSVEVNLDC